MLVQGRADGGDVRERIAAVYRSESRRILATLIRLLGDFDLAEEALQEAFTQAVQRWPIEGVPANPGAWLVSAGRFRAIDMLRRRARFDKSLAVVAEEIDRAAPEPAAPDDGITDDRLRLVFTCCHPALSPDAQVALTLREVCGLTTEEIARAFLTSATTIAQRIVRAKAKIRDARIPYEVPDRPQLAERLAMVLHVIYLVFNEGYSATGGDSATRPDLSGEAIRLGRLLVELLPDGETMGLLALMLLHEARRAARTSADGDIVLLEEQDRSRWDPRMIAEGDAWVQRALATRAFGPYTLQAAIAGIHAQSPSPQSTDWNEIVALYDLLLRVEPTPVVALNRAAAVAMRDGAESGLALIDRLLEGSELASYSLAHAARADLCRRLGRRAEAIASYERALALTKLAPEQRFIARRLSALR